MVAAHTGAVNGAVPGAGDGIQCGVPSRTVRRATRAPVTMTIHRLLSPRDFRRVPWRNGAGHTSEIAAGPDAEAFAWRVSIAEIERDGPFSDWPGVDRTLVLLDGRGVVLAQDDVEVAMLAQHEPYRFAGDRACSCRLVRGPARAFNLMVRRTRARGDVVVVEGAAAIAGPFRHGVCYAAQGASECLLPGHAPIGVAPGHALVVDAGERIASMHVNPIDAGAVAIVAAVVAGE
ncbi:Protein Ves [Burkholderiales bacterium]|nr:Protein Ves [Burkholderiales bacterium]